MCALYYTTHSETDYVHCSSHVCIVEWYDGAILVILINKITCLCVM